MQLLPYFTVFSVVLLGVQCEEEKAACPFTSCSYFKNKHGKLNADAFKKCPLAKSCPHFVKPLEGEMYASICASWCRPPHPAGCFVPIFRTRLGSHSQREGKMV